MGHRCNYVKRENGAITLYYSHWGALAIARDFFWGRDAALRFLEGHDPKDAEWLDDVFGEGAAAVDLDERTLTISGGEIYGPSRTLLVELAGVIWGRDGFTVRDVDSIADVAAAVGVDRAEVEAEHLADPPLDPANDDMTGRSDARFGAAIVVDDVVRFTRDARNVLELGEASLATASQLPDLAEAKRLWEERPAPEWENPKRTISERVHNFVVIDTSVRRIETTPYVIRNDKSRHHFATKWPGWELTTREQNAVRSALNLPDLPPLEPEPDPPLEDMLAEIEGYLGRSGHGDLGKWFAEWSAKDAAAGAWINPRAVVPTRDGRPADPVDANDILRSAVVEVVARRRRH